MPYKTINEETKKLIKEYYLSKPMTLDEVGKKFNLCRPTISKILKDIPRYTKAKIKSP
jgi:DNA-directed RNA polymerase sigma subunit (sigma70/sigma32)